MNYERFFWPFVTNILNWLFLIFNWTELIFHLISYSNYLELIDSFDRTAGLENRNSVFIDLKVTNRLNTALNLPTTLQFLKQPVAFGTCNCVICQLNVILMVTNFSTTFINIFYHSKSRKSWKNEQSSTRQTFWGASG